MATDRPHAKVIAGGIAGAVTTIAVWVVGHWWPVPAEIAVALSTVVTFAVSYLTPPGVTDSITPTSDQP